ncbi:unnamed protein product [Lactuca virosa]|uniref:Uncharacterized protein n=1 Tax=Lactuca virosa TaxID=75947 RepID=A0AAU9NEZ2_9ASTR|nr:unnamed protein product [Lactuca virosa]
MSSSSMAFYMSSISSSGDNFTLDQYVHKYPLSIVHGVTLHFSSSSILEPLAGKVGFYLRHLVSRLRLPPSSFFLEVFSVISFWFTVFQEQTWDGKENFVRVFSVLQEEFDMAFQLIAHVDDIFAIANGKKLKLYDGLLSLRDRYLFSEVNLCISEGMKSADKEVLFDTGKHHVELSAQFRVASGRINFLENQCSLLEADYEAFLRENDVLHAQLTGKSS